ncbi:MAG: DUF2730 family protein [Gammaproteobacteria bacterium]|nr:DUF2730 family protein [Gammaproteobacteria bacterium]
MNKEDLYFWKFIFDMAQTVFMVGISIYVWIITKHKVNADKINQLEDNHNQEIHDIKNRLTHIETTIKHMPDREQISRIHRRIDDLSQGVSRMEGELKGLTDDSAMILQTLIEQGKNK